MVPGLLSHVLVLVCAAACWLRLFYVPRDAISWVEMLELAGSGVLTKASHTRCPDQGFSLVCITLMVFPHQEINKVLSISDASSRAFGPQARRQPSDTHGCGWWGNICCAQKRVHAHPSLRALRMWWWCWQNFTNTSSSTHLCLNSLSVSHRTSSSKSCSIPSCWEYSIFVLWHRQSQKFTLSWDG
jgi:hypothetical protein